MKVYELITVRIDFNGRPSVMSDIYEDQDYAKEQMMSLGKYSEELASMYWKSINVDIKDDHYVISQVGTKCRIEIACHEKEVKTLKSYTVRVPIESYKDVEVKAENEDAARAIALHANVNTEDMVHNIKKGKPEIIPNARRVRVDWDTNGEETDLPDVVDVPAGFTDDRVADYISDVYGYCINGWYEVEE